MSALFNKDIVVLDVTSRTVTAVAGCKKAQSVYDVKARTVKEYDGYSDGEFFDADAAASAVCDALKETLAASGVVPRRLFVGVPGEFVTLVNRPVTVTLDRVRRVVDADIEYLAAKGGVFEDGAYVLIGSSPTNFTSTSAV